jgi:16S rRNA G966 N2-methylase RsmD
MSSKPFGADSLASRASRHEAGVVVVECDTEAVGVIERFESVLVKDSKVAMVAKEAEEERNCG